MQNPWDRWAEGSMRFALGGEWGMLCERQWERAGQMRDELEEMLLWRGELHGEC